MKKNMILIALLLLAACGKDTVREHKVCSGVLASGTAVSYEYKIWNGWLTAGSCSAGQTTYFQFHDDDERERYEGRCEAGTAYFTLTDAVRAKTSAETVTLNCSDVQE